MNEILKQFISEAREHLSFLDANLQNLLDADEELINALFRAAHTLKGSGGLAGFEAVKNITHVAEDILDNIRNRNLQPTEEIIEALYDAFDLVVELIDEAEDIGKIPETSNQRISEVIENMKKFSEKYEETIVTELYLETDPVPIAKYIDINNMSDCINMLKSYRNIKIDNEFLKNENFYIIDIDIDENSLINANDPIYILSLLKYPPYSVYSIVSCIKSGDPLLLRTRFIVVVKATAQELEDVFYNILDEIIVYPLSFELLLENDLQEANIEELKDFQESFKIAVENEQYDKAKQCLKDNLKFLSPDTKEHFILERGLFILENVESEKYGEIFDIIGEFLNIPINKAMMIEEKICVDTDNNELSVLKNILQQQIRILKLSKDDMVVERVKLLLKNAIGDETINEMNSKEELEKFIPEILKRIDENFVKEKKSEQFVPEHEPAKKNKLSKIYTTPKMIKVEQKEIDMLLDLTGEMLVFKNALPYIAESLGPDTISHAKREIMSKYEEITRITEQLQDKIMSMRLMPLSYIFDRYPKLVRDISKKLGKKVEFIQEGGETKLDKTVIEMISEPFVHIIRNCLDHGIEVPEERIRKGKSEKGVIKISAKSNGDKVFISIEDDGAGINIDKVVNKALEKRLVEPDTIDNMSREEKLKLIFHPGLSTKDEVTELSGRGVGADAIKKISEQLGGNIYIESEKDKGTIFKLEIPISVALTNVFHIKANNINYAVPTENIIETVEIKKEEIRTANKLPYISLRGELIPLIFEERILNRDNLKNTENALIIQGKKRKYAFVVDSFVEQLYIMSKPFDGILKEHPFISGASLLGNGEVLFILDIFKILNE